MDIRQQLCKGGRAVFDVVLEGGEIGREGPQMEGDDAGMVKAGQLTQHADEHTERGGLLPAD